MLTACASQTEIPPEQTVDIAKDVLTDKNVLRVERVDTDSDGKLEWLVFYRYDQVGQHGPVAALVYDVASGASQLPAVYPYRLRMPDQTYLAQDVPKVSMVEVLPEPGGVTPRKELMLFTEQELAFFRVNGNAVNLPVDDPPLYRCIGFFRSDGGVSFNSDNAQVTVTSRQGYERSQLVTRYYYKPGPDGYFITGTTTLMPPFASAVDFAEGVPSAILDTPYPEKIVLAFYKSLKPDARATILEYLTAQAANEFTQGRLNYGSPFPLDQINFAVVKEIGYYPTQEDSKAAVVTVKVTFQSTSGQNSPLTEVRWNLVREQNRWKMAFPQP
jgi:hypothetical protein